MWNWLPNRAPTQVWWVGLISAAIIQNLWMAGSTAKTGSAFWSWWHIILALGWSGLLLFIPRLSRR